MKQPTKLTLSEIDAALIGAGFTYGPNSGTYKIPAQWTEVQVRHCIFIAPGYERTYPVTRVRAMAALVEFIEKYETQ